MTTNSILSWIGVFIFFTGLISSGIVGILYIRKASSPQWSNLTWWKKYIFPVIVLTVTVLIMDIGVTIAFVYGKGGQVTSEDLVIASKIGTGFSGCMLVGFLYAYFIGIWTARAQARGLVPRIGLKKKN